MTFFLSGVGVLLLVIYQLGLHAELVKLSPRGEIILFLFLVILFFLIFSKLFIPGIKCASDPASVKGCGDVLANLGAPIAELPAALNEILQGIQLPAALNEVPQGIQVHIHEFLLELLHEFPEALPQGIVDELVDALLHEFPEALPQEYVEGFVEELVEELFQEFPEAPPQGFWPGFLQNLLQSLQQAAPLHGPPI